MIERKDQQRVVTVTANVAGRAEGSVARDLQASLASLPRPGGHEVEVAGTFEEQEKATRELVISSSCVSSAWWAAIPSSRRAGSWVPAGSSTAMVARASSGSSIRDGMLPIVP